MSIPKHQRSPSRLDAQHLAKKISLEITTELARTFGYSKAKFEKHIEAMTKHLPPGPDREQAAQQIREQEQDFNLWLIEQERKKVHDLSRDIPLHLRGANSIWPSCQLELDERRLELDKAIAACGKLQDELEYVAEAIPADFNKLIEALQRYGIYFFPIIRLRHIIGPFVSHPVIRIAVPLGRIMPWFLRFAHQL